MRVGHNAFVNRYIAGRIKKAAKASEKLAEGGISFKKKNKLIETVRSAEQVIDKYEPVTVADSVMSHLVSMNVKKELLAEYAGTLLSDEKSIQCKKTGIAFLGTFGTAKDIPAVMSLAKNEEFTFFAVKALKQLEGDGAKFTDDCAEIASETSGWGKIAAILELSDNIESEDVRKFLLASGTSNSIGKYHLAVECAIKGRLYEYLENCLANDINPGRDMSEGICDIFKGLIEAESVKNADGFSEVENIDAIVGDFCKMYEKGSLECPNALEIYNYLKNRK